MKKQMKADADTLYPGLDMLARAESDFDKKTGYTEADDEDYRHEFENEYEEEESVDDSSNDSGEQPPREDTQQTDPIKLISFKNMMLLLAVGLALLFLNN